MPLRPVSQRNNLGLRSDHANLALNHDSSSDDSYLDNLALHRPKCPWSRRQSYINRVKKTVFYESSINCIQKHSQSSNAKKPWLASTSFSKNPEVWQRPLGKKKHAEVNCFCTRQEQAKVKPPPRKQCTLAWIENRRNHIVNKFDGFSKNILKITGKLSRETISMITAKIKENLEKNYDFSMQNINNSSIRMPSLSKTSCPFPTVGERSSCEGLIKVPSKILPEVSCIKVALVSSDMNIFAKNMNKNQVKNEDISLDNATNKYTIASSEIPHFKVVSVCSNNAIVGEKKSAMVQKPCEKEQMPPGIEEDSIISDSNSLNKGDCIRNNRKIDTIKDKGIFMNDESHNFYKDNEVMSSNDDKVIPQCKSILVCHNTTVFDNAPLDPERPLYVNNAIASSLERPVSPSEKSVSSTGKPSSCDGRVLQSAQKHPCRNSPNFREKSVTFAKKPYSDDNHFVNKPVSAGSASSNNPPAECKTLNSLLRYESSSVKNYRCESAHQDKPMSADNKDSNSIGNESECRSSNGSDPFCDSKFVRKYISCSNTKNLITGENGSLLAQNSLTRNKVNEIRFTGRSMKDLNEKPNSADGTYPSWRHSINKQIRTNEKNVSFSDTTYNSASSKHIRPMSADLKPSTPVQRHSFTVHERTAPVRNNAVNFEKKTFSGGDKMSKLDDASSKYEDNSNLRVSRSYQRRKRDIDVSSKMNVMKSSLDIVKSLQPMSSRNVLSVPSKNSFQLSARKKVLVDRNKKSCPQAGSTDGATGYTVQLVKLKNYHGLENSRK